MTIASWLKLAEKKLASVYVSTARLDSLILLEDTLNRDRAWVLANPDFMISAAQIKKLNNLLMRRMEHVPLAFLRGKTEFYGREFVISSAVLEPRPESETMIDCLLKLPIDAKKCRIADIGSGSGAIGITAALELDNPNVDLIEIDPKAIKVLKTNVDIFTPNLKVIKSDLLRDTAMSYDVLLCNLPYVPDDYNINLAATHEPRLAIFGGKDGLDVYRSLFNQLMLAPKRPLYILTEALPPQHETLGNIASHCGYKLKMTDDFIQVFYF